MARSLILRLRATETEREFIKRLAKLEGMNASEFVRQAIREAARSRGMPPVGALQTFKKISERSEVQNGNER